MSFAIVNVGEVREVLLHRKMVACLQGMNGDPAVVVLDLAPEVMGVIVTELILVDGRLVLVFENGFALDFLEQTVSHANIKGADNSISVFLNNAQNGFQRVVAEAIFMEERGFYDFIFEDGFVVRLEKKVSQFYGHSSGGWPNEIEVSLRDGAHGQNILLMRTVEQKPIRA